MTPDSASELTTIWLASQEPWRNIRAFYFAAAAYIPYPDNLSVLSRLLAGPFPAIQDLTDKFIQLALKGQDDKVRELFDDLQYRPWVHMPWVKEELI
jgi:hypothetical protein